MIHSFHLLSLTAHVNSDECLTFLVRLTIDAAYVA